MRYQPSDKELVVKYLLEITYDDYDRLLQLCDALAISYGFVPLEKRFIDLVLRHGLSTLALEKWCATFELQNHFEGLIGCSIYKVIDGVIENTYKLK